MILDSITNRFQLKFKDRVWAANILAEEVKDIIKKEKMQKEDIVILGIPRGGIITADCIAQKLDVPDTNFDVVIPRKFGPKV
jgi:putative phosphoribosyl transferase